MKTSFQTVLGGRYKLTGKFVQGSSTRAREAWDRWLDRYVAIKILPGSRVDCEAAKRGFIDSSGALTRIDHPHVEPLLDYGATEEGVPYHVMPARKGSDLATLLAADGAMAWVHVQAILLGVIAGVHALHQRCIVHREISLHTIVIADGSVLLVDVGEAELCDEAPTPEQLRDVVLGIAAVGFALLTGLGPQRRSVTSIEAALAQTDAPPAVQAMLLGVLADQRPEAPCMLGMADMHRVIAATAVTAPRPRWRPRIVDLAAAAAAAAMLIVLVMGAWSSSEILPSGLELDLQTQSPEGDRSQRARQTDHAPLVWQWAPSPESAVELACVATPVNLVGPDSSLVEPMPLTAGFEAPFETGFEAGCKAGFEPGRAHLEVVAEAQHDAATIQTQRFDLAGRPSPSLHGSPAKLVERGIDLTHGRPILEDDPRLPLVDGPERARALFQAACSREFGKGCHMLGVQIAEGMIADDDGAGPAEHYQRGCELGYHRSCAALADLARDGSVLADIGLLEAKACLLAGPGSSYCLPQNR